MPEPTTKPGSRSHAIAMLVLEESQQLGRGLETAEIRKLYEEREGEPAPSSLTSEVYSLAKRGILVRCGGRTGHTLFCHRDAVLEVQTPEDDVVLVLKALQSAYRRHGRPLSTREVDEELERKGLELENDYPNAVRRHLLTLCRDRERGPEGWREAKATKIDEEATTGADATFWLPAGARPRQKAPSPRSRADAVREAVGEAQRALGRPVASHELAWWLEAVGEEGPIGEVLEPQRLGTDLSNTARTDAGHKGDDGRIHTLAGPLACHGGPPKRYGLGSIDEEARALCGFEDALLAFRPDEELRGIEALELRAGGGAGVLGDLARLRREALAAALGRHGRGQDPGELAERSEEAAGVLEAWHERADLTHDQAYARRRALRELRANLAAARRVGVDGAADIMLTGEAALTTPEGLGPLLESAARLAGVEAGTAARLVTAARRFPNPELDPERRFGHAGEEPLSLVDRVDAIVQVVGSVLVPRTLVLTQAAHQLLGHVVRDKQALSGLLERVPPQAQLLRNGLTVALGLLGRLPALDRAVPDPAQAQDARAYVMAALFAAPASSRGAIEAGQDYLTHGARRVLDEAMSRLAGGFAISLVE